MLRAAARDGSLAAVHIAWADATSCAALGFFLFPFSRRPVLHTGHLNGRAVTPNLREKGRL